MPSSMRRLGLIGFSCRCLEKALLLTTVAGPRTRRYQHGIAM